MISRKADKGTISINIGSTNDAHLDALSDKLEAAGIDDYETAYACSEDDSILFSFPADREADAIDALLSTDGLRQTFMARSFKPRAAEIPDCTTGEQAIGGVPDMTGDTGMDIGDLEM